MLQTLAIVAELEGIRRSLVTPAKVCLGVFTLLSTVQHMSSSSKVHAL